MLRRLFALAVILALAMSASAGTPHGVDAKHLITVDGRTREYTLHVPPHSQNPAPLVIVFHGGGGNARRMGKFSGFSELADQNGFLAVYPQGWKNNWNDGREPASSRTHKENVDDVKFIGAMLDEIGRTRVVDAKRIYAVGISNGAFFCNYLASHMAERLAAICPISGGIAAPFALKFNPRVPVSVMIIQGDEDPLVPINGGIVAKKRGTMISTAETLQKWLGSNGCSGKPETSQLPDRDPKDGCRVEKTVWHSCRGGTEVEYLLIKGGGHTWPSRIQYLPQFMVGRVCRDIDSPDIWEFFLTHPRKQ